MRGKTLINPGVWWALTLTSVILLSGEAFAIMPDATFLPPVSPTASEHSNTPNDALSDATDSVENFPGMLQRVINFEDEKLTAQRERFLKAERALRKRRFTQFKKIYLPWRTTLSTLTYGTNTLNNAWAELSKKN